MMEIEYNNLVWNSLSYCTTLYIYMVQFYAYRHWKKYKSKGVKTVDIGPSRQNKKEDKQSDRADSQFLLDCIG